MLLAGQLTEAHLDSCASHCFVDNRTSKELQSRGYPAQSSNTHYNVVQGQPLCTTNKVHYLPLSIVREDGTVSSWDQCLFVVANAGAPIIICNPLLRIGGIVTYAPPAGYEKTLTRLAEKAATAPRRPSKAAGTEEPYATPPHVARVLKTELVSVNGSTEDAGSSPSMDTTQRPLDSNSLVPESSTKLMAKSTDELDNIDPYSREQSPPLTELPETSGLNSVQIIQDQNLGQQILPSLAASGGNGEESEYQGTSGNSMQNSQLAEAYTVKISKQTSKLTTSKKGEVNMLTEECPYGKNPPLPEEVMEAIRHLKLLADPKTTPKYSDEQVEELCNKLGKLRPSWSKCLTAEHIAEISDKETERFINEMMDKPLYQKSIFADCLKNCCDLKEYEIPQKPGRDMWTPAQPRRYKTPRYSLLVNDWLDGLINNAKVRESKATHPAPITVVERDMRDARICIDYRNRNARSEVPIYPMPDVQDFLEETAGFKHYCSFDMAKMFNQFRIKEEDKHLAAFITERGVYEPNVVMFGLQGGPQHAVRECGGEMLKDPLTNGKLFTEWALEQNQKGVQPPYEICPLSKVVKGSRLRPFIDDVNIPSNHTEGMKKLVELFFEFCRKHNLILSRKKAQIMKAHLRMLGFVVSRQGKHLDPQRIIALLEAKKPQSKETLHALLSSFTFVRMFIPNFASIAAPLHEATRGIIWKGPGSGRSQGTREVDPDFIWSPEMTRAYDQLRNALLEAPILVAIDWSYPLFLSVDASIRGEGWVLWQLVKLQNGTKVAVAILYGSRKYSGSERNWETTRQEASAIRSALNDVYSYVFGQHFYLFSDHLNLRFMHNSINRAVLRMRDFLSQFNMTVVHCPGVWNNADSVSRLETESLPTSLDLDASIAEARLQGNSTLFSIGTSTEEDPFIGGSTTLQPRNPSCVEIASALCTTAHSGNESMCLLCSLKEEIQWEENETGQETTSTALLNQVATQVFDQEDQLLNWASMTPLKFHCSDNELRLEAENWNLRMNKDPVLGLPFQQNCPTASENEEAEKEQDDEDWCGPLDRNTCTTVDAEPHRFLPNVCGTANPASQNATEVMDNNTQTTPADFRMATIRIPMIDDFRAIHNNSSGHHGVDFSYRKLLKHCGSKWANERGEASKVKALLKEFIESCPICQKVRGLKEKVKTKHSLIVSRPFLEVSIDFIVFKRDDKYGNRYLIVAISNFLKLVEMKPAQHRDAETVARFLLELQSRYGPMARLRSDKDGAFTGLLIKRLNDARGTETNPCIPYHPQANSVCERQNAIIMNHLNALILGCALGPESKIGWSDLIPNVFSLVNNTPKNPLGISPLSLVYGVFANYDQPLLDQTCANTPGSETNPVDYLESLMAWQNKLLEISEDVQSQHFEKLHAKLNKEEKNRQFQVGDYVLQLRKSTGASGKPGTIWAGPFLVMDRRDNDPSHPVLDLMNLTNMKVKEASIADCRTFNTSWFEEGNLHRELVKLAATDDNEYVVERILAHQPEGENRCKPLSKYLFQVKWQDFEEPTWEPYSNLKDLDPMEEYSKLHPGLKLSK